MCDSQNVPIMYRDKPNVVNIYIEAPRVFCVNRTIANSVTEAVANATIRRTDRFRADYYKYYTHKLLDKSCEL